MKLLRIMGQVITVFLIIFIGIFLLKMNIPGNEEFCDADHGITVVIRYVFLISCFIYIINSIIFHKKGIWKKYRERAIKLTCLLIFLCFSLKWIILHTYYGREKHTISDNNGRTLLDLRLYENGKFFVSTYDLSCYIENTGTYLIHNNKITLQFKKEKSDYLGTEYEIKNKKIVCLNCKYETDLIIKNTN